MERSHRGTVLRVPERFNEVEAASDYLASLLVRTSPMAGIKWLVKLLVAHPPPFYVAVRGA